MSLITIGSKTKIESQNDLRTLTNNQAMQDYVISEYKQINLKKTFAELVDCGKLLQIAYAAAGKEPCSVDIVSILSKYQTAVHFSTITSHKFVLTSIEALKKHKKAIGLVEISDDDEDMIEDNDETIAPLIACYEFATQMEKEAKLAASKITELSDLTEIAITSAQADTARTETEKKGMREEIVEVIARSKALEESAKRYNTMVNRLEKEKDAAERKAENARKEANSFGNIVKDIATAAVPVITQAAQAFINPYGALMPQPQMNPQQTSSESAAGVPTHTGNNESDLEDLKTEKDTAEGILQSANNDKDKNTPEGREKIEKAKQKVVELANAVNSIAQGMKEARNAQNQFKKDLEDKHSDLQKQYFDMAEKEAENAANQAKTLSRLGNMRESHTSIQQSIILLGFTVSILGGVKTTFLNVATVWTLLANECGALIRIKDDIKGDYESYLKKLEKKGSKAEKTVFYKKLVWKHVMDGARKWAAVGSVSLQAHDGILSAKNTVDDVMRNLPANATQQELQNLIKTMEPRLGLKNEELKKNMANIEKLK